MTVDIEEEITKILQPHFEAHQLQNDDDGDTTTNPTTNNNAGATTPYKKKKQKQQQKRCYLSAESRVTQIKNQISLFASSSSIDTNEENNQVALSKAMASILVQYIDAAISTEASGSDIQESIDRVLELAAALACNYSEVACQAIVSRAIQYSTTVLERIRAHACNLLGHLAYYLGEKEESAMTVMMTPTKKSRQKQKQSSAKKVRRESSQDAAGHYQGLNRAVQDALLPRLTDKSASVRYAAIQACGNVFRNHDCENQNDDLLEALLWNLSHDPSISSRIAAIHSVPIQPETVNNVITRIRESKWKVRIEALDVLHEKANFITDLSEQQRLQIIRYGLTDRCEKTKEATTKICIGWMKAVKYDPIALLKLLDVVDNEEECVKIVNVILEASRSNNNESALLQEFSEAEIRAFRSTVQANSKQMIRIDDEEVENSIEQIFFSRVVCSNAIDAAKNNVISSTEKETIIGKILPEVPIVCDMFEKQSMRLMEALEMGDTAAEDMHIFLCMQILQFAAVADLNEEGSRRHFCGVMKRMLSSLETPDELIEGCIRALKLVHDDEIGIIKTVSEIINDITPDTESGSETTPNTKNATDMLIIRKLSILSILLETTSVTVSTCELVMEFQRYIVPSVVHSNPLVREAGVSCFGKLGLFTSSDKVCSEYKALLLEVASNENEKDEIRAQAVLSLSDWAMLFADILKPCAIATSTESDDDDHDDEDGTKMVSFVDIVSNLFGHARPGVVAVAAEVAAKLLFSGKVCDSNWIAELMLIYFDPRMTSNESSDVDNSSQNDDVQEVGNLARLQQLLSLFFPAFSVKNEAGRDALLESISLFLRTLYTKANRKVGKRTKASWPAVKMIDYVCSVVDVGKREATATSNTDEDAPTSGDKSKVISKEEEEEREGNDNDNASIGASADPGSSAGAVKSSTKLLASLQVAEFLNENSGINVTSLRALCKYLGNLDIDIESEEFQHLVTLKGFMEDLSMAITDSTSLRSLTKLNDLLVDIEVDDDEDESEDEDEEEEEGEQGDKQSDDGTLSEEESSSEDDFFKDKTVDLSISVDYNDKENSGGNTTKKNRGQIKNAPLAVKPGSRKKDVQPKGKRRSPRNVASNYGECF